MSNAVNHDLLWNDRLLDRLDDVTTSEPSLEAHLANCERCQRQLEKFTQLDQVLQSALPQLGLNEAFDQRILARIETVDESQRAAVRMRIEYEIQAALHELAKGRRRAIALAFPAFVSGTVLALSFLGWSDDSGYARALLEQIVGEYGRDATDRMHVMLTIAIGGGIGFIIAGWLTATTE